MFGIIAVGVFLLLWGAAEVLLKKWYAIGIFNAMWAVVFFACASVLKLPEFGKTLSLLMIMVTMVNLGYLGAKFVPKKHLSIRKKRVEYVFNEKLMIALMAVVVCILGFYAFKTIRTFGFDLQAIRSGNNSGSELRVFNGKIDTVLFYGIAMPMTYVCAIVLSYNFSRKIKLSVPLLVLEILAVGLNILAVAGRSILIRIVLFFAAAVLLRLRRGQINKKLVLIFIGAGIVFLGVMELTTLVRNEWEVSFLQQAMDYIRGSVGHMQYRLARLTDRTNHFGYVVLGGFLYFPVKILAALGFDIKTSNEIMFYLQSYVSVIVGEGKVGYNALVPNVFYHYYDSGYLGAVIFPSLLGFFCRTGRAHLQAGRIFGICHLGGMYLRYDIFPSGRSSLGLQISDSPHLLRDFEILYLRSQKLKRLG